MGATTSETSENEIVWRIIPAVRQFYGESGMC